MSHPVDMARHPEMTWHSFSAWLSDCGVGALPYLFDTAMKGSIVLLIGAAAVWILRHQSAGLRYRVHVFAMLCLLALPALSPLLPKWEIPTRVPSALVFERQENTNRIKNLSPHEVSATSGHFKRKQRGTDNNTLDIAPAHPFPTAPAIPLDSQPARLSGSTSHSFGMPVPVKNIKVWQVWVAMTWLVGAVVTLLPLIMGVWKIRRIRRAATTVTNIRLLRSFEAVRAQPGLSIPLRRRILLVKSRKITVPLTSGILRPCILLPCESESWPAEKQRLVLLHELIHIRKKDCLSHMLGRAALALHWFNPLAWRAMKSMVLEGEKACDDQVIRCCSRPLDYASCLLDIARSLGSCRATHAAAITMTQASNLEQRLRMILDATRKRAEPTWITRLVIFLCAMLLVAPLAFLQCTGQAVERAPESQGFAMDNDNSDPASILKPNKGDHYIVLAAMDEANPYYRAAERLAAHHGAMIVRFDMNDLDALLTELKYRQPRYAAVVIEPSGIDTNTVRRFCMMSTRVDADPFCDFAWGFITGATADEAMRFVQNIIRAGREGVPARLLESGVAECRSMLQTDIGPEWLRGAGFESDLIYFGLEDEREDLDQFVETNLDAFENKGIIQITGCGDPERIWLFDDRRNSADEKHWDFDPGKVGQNIEGEMYWIDSTMIRGLDLYPAVISCGTGYSGTVGNVLFQNDLVSTFGRVDGTRAYDMPRNNSLCLAYLSAGVTAAFLPVGPSHGWRTCVETDRMLSSGVPLGDVMKSCYDELVLACNGPMRLSELKPGDDEWDQDVYSMMRDDAASRVLYGDPAFVPFEGTGDQALRVDDPVLLADGRYRLTSEVRLPFDYGDLRASRFVDMFTPFKTVIPLVTDLPEALAVQGIRGITLVDSETNEELSSFEIRWAEEEWEGRVRLHLAAFSMDSPETLCPRALTFLIEPALDPMERRRQGSMNHLTPIDHNDTH